MQHPTSTWEALQDGAVFYRKQPVYSLQWRIQDLSDYIIAGARYGGPLAMIRDDTKLVALGRQSFIKPQIQIYSSSGRLILSINWDNGKIIRMGWTFDERLVVLNEEGFYRLYDLQGEYNQFSLGNEASETGIIDARVFESGLVALTGQLALMEVKGWQGGKPLTLASAGLSEPPHTWAVIPPDQSISRHAEVLLSHEHTILSVDTLECIDQRLDRGPFTHICPSPNGKSLAMLTMTGTLWVVSADFQRNLAEYDTSLAGADGPPQRLAWCGNDALVVGWDSLVLLVGPFGDVLRYFYTSPTIFITEIDGIRILSSDNCDFIQKVPTSTEKVFRPGSTSPSAMLYDASEHYLHKSPKADDNIRTIRPELASAVDDCVDAAGREWEVYWQRRLLDAAKYGRAFLDLYNPGDFVAMGQTLKVLNAVRFYEIGIPITYAQYQLTSPQHLLTRLTARSLHLLALRMSSFLSLKPDAVLKDWACAKIARTKPSVGPNDTTESSDEKLSEMIVEKFQSLGTQGSGVSYAEIAKKAWEIGRRGLATKLLDHESRAAEQVPLLLGMKEDRLALEKAVDSGDTDLVYHVLLHLHRRLALGAFFQLIEDGGPRLIPASKLLQVYAREQNREMLKDFYYSDDRRLESGLLALEEATVMEDPTAKAASIKAAGKFFSEDRDRGFEAKMMEESLRLLNLQQTLEKESPDGKVAFYGLSVGDTIERCLVNGMTKRAEKVRADWRVSDKRFWHIKLRALTTIKDFEGLDAFAKSKRSPIGYEIFVRHIVGKGHPSEAVPFVARCDAPRRADLYVLCGEWRMAGRECKERGDKAKLEEIARACPDTLIQRELDQLFNSMK